MKRLVTRLAARFLRQIVDFGKLVHPCACLSKIWGVRVREDSFVIVTVEVVYLRLISEAWCLVF